MGTDTELECGARMMHMLLGENEYMRAWRGLQKCGACVFFHYPP
jgi:hypothetical protein